MSLIMLANSPSGWGHGWMRKVTPLNPNLRSEIKAVAFIGSGVIVARDFTHISKETTAWIASQPAGRFSFVFTPKHGSWLNLVQGFFSKMARSMLRHIRVASKAELKSRILAYLDDLNREPVIHSWTYKIADAA